MIEVQELIEAIENAGYEARSYSGRGMYGKECVGVTIEEESEMWALATEFGRNDIEVRAPRTDSLGRSIIIYWPSFPWPEEA